MSIDWASFTPQAALLGGLIIGLAASVLLLVNGRIAGISGIIANLIQPKAGEIGWRAAFASGLILSPLLLKAIQVPVSIGQPQANTATLVAAGLLVGVGTRMASGCTSGHGVCGLSRRSMRSLAATATFMAFGFTCVFITHHVIA